LKTHAFFFKSYLVAFAMAVLVFPMAADPWDGGISVKGRVVAKDDLRPLPQSIITINGTVYATTNDSGYFDIQIRSAGLYRLHIQHLICEHLDLEIFFASDTFILLALPHTHHVIQGAEVTGLRHGIATQKNLGPKELSLEYGKSIGQIMEALPGVTALQTGGTISKPMVNGLYGYRTLLIQNDVRQEGQNWGQEHAPEIDPFHVRSITLMKGPQALAYGPEGIGGVIVIQSPSVFNYRKDQIDGQVRMAGGSNGRKGVVSATMGSRHFQQLPIYWQVMGTAQIQGHLHTPDHYIDNTANREHHLSWSAGTHIKHVTTDAYYSRFQNQFGIYSGSHIGNLSDLNQAISGQVRPIDRGFSYQIAEPMQKALHELFRLRTYYKMDDHAYLKVVYARQFNQRQEYDLHLSNVGNPDMDLKLTTHTLDVSYTFETRHGVGLQTSVFLLDQDNTFRGRFFVPNFEHNGLGSSITAVKRYGKHEFSAGVRYDKRRINAYFLDPTLQFQTPKRGYDGGAGSLQWQYNANPSTTISGHAALNWRPPMPNELYSMGVHHGTATYEEGNPNLHAESGWSSEWEISKVIQPGLVLYSGVFVQYIRDFINLIPASEPKQTIRGAFPYFYYDQTHALLRGINYALLWNTHKRWEVQHKGFVMMADDVHRRAPLPQMPPFSFGWQVTHIRGNLRFQINGNMVMRQFRLEEGADFAPPPPTFFIAGFEVSGNTHIARQPLSFFLTGDNIFNVRYRHYLDRFRYFTDMPGINIRVGVSMPISY